MDRKFFDISKIDKILWMEYLALIVDLLILFYFGPVPWLYLADCDIYHALLVLVIFMPLIIVLLWSFIYLVGSMILHWKFIESIKTFLIFFYLILTFIFLAFIFLFIHPHSVTNSKLIMEMRNIIEMQESTNQMIQEYKTTKHITIK